MRLATSIAVLLLSQGYALDFAEAISFPIYRKSVVKSGWRELGKRDEDNTGSFGNGSTTLTNKGDDAYFCDVTLGGEMFSVQIDTGSTDLWVKGPVPNAKDVGAGKIDFQYAVGTVSGDVNTAELKLDSFTISDQAFVNADQAEDVGVDGILGLGPSSGSSIRQRYTGSRGDPPLDRIFKQNNNTPNFITILLSRNQTTESSRPLEETQPGQLTIGEVIPEYKDILNMPKLDGLVDQFNAPHWETLLDGNGIIGPDGQRINTTTRIQNPKNGDQNQLHVAFDSGFTNPQLPRDIVDAIYGRVPNAKFVQNGNSVGLGGEENFWVIPCDYELNVSFVFANKEYPMAPLDLTTQLTDKNHKPICMANFQQMQQDLIDDKGFGAVDIILGMAFLRSAYLLIDFGDFVDGSSSSVGDPYIQLLSVVGKSSAHTDFVNARLGGKDTTGTQAALVPPDQAQHSPDTPSSDSDDDDDDEPFYKKTWFLVSVSCAGALFLVLMFWCLNDMCRGRRSTIRSERVFTPGMRSYRPLAGGSREGFRPLNMVYQAPAYRNG